MARTTLADADLAALVAEWLDWAEAAAPARGDRGQGAHDDPRPRAGRRRARPRAPGRRSPPDFIQDGLPVKGLPGLLTVLHDGGYDDRESIAWLYLDDDLPGRPIDALRENRGSEVKRRAQAMALLTALAAPGRDVEPHDDHDRGDRLRDDRRHARSSSGRLRPRRRDDRAVGGRPHRRRPRDRRIGVECRRHRPGERAAVGRRWPTCRSRRQATVALIDEGGPFPYEQGRRRRSATSRGCCRTTRAATTREYTVIDARARPTAARAGSWPVTGGELYWTEDHYASFERIAETA